MTNDTQPITTWKGSVVYARKKHEFKWRDAARVTTKLFPPVSAEEKATAIVLFVAVKRDLVEAGLLTGNVDNNLLDEAIRDLDRAFNSFIALLQDTAEQLDPFERPVDDRSFFERLLLPLDPN